MPLKSTDGKDECSGYIGAGGMSAKEHPTRYFQLSAKDREAWSESLRFMSSAFPAMPPSPPLSLTLMAKVFLPALTRRAGTV